jgi:hypothetical protein
VGTWRVNQPHGTWQVNVENTPVAPPWGSTQYLAIDGAGSVDQAATFPTQPNGSVILSRVMVYAPSTGRAGSVTMQLGGAVAQIQVDTGGNVTVYDGGMRASAALTAAFQEDTWQEWQIEYIVAGPSGDATYRIETAEDFGAPQFGLGSPHRLLLNNGSGDEVYFDAVSIIPEPASALLVAATAVALLRRR